MGKIQDSWAKFLWKIYVCVFTKAPPRFSVVSTGCGAFVGESTKILAYAALTNVGLPKVGPDNSRNSLESTRAVLFW
jgi:hypothetical protein